jgi:hypothetical protein
MATKQPKPYRHAQIKLYRNRGNQNVTSRTNAVTMERGNYGNPSENESLSHQSQYVYCIMWLMMMMMIIWGFYCLIFGFVQWSRENKHNAGLHKFYSSPNEYSKIFWVGQGMQHTCMRWLTCIWVWLENLKRGEQVEGVNVYESLILELI